MLEESRRQELRQSLKTAVDTRDTSLMLTTMRELIHAESKPADVQLCARAATALAPALAHRPGIRPLRTFIVRSVTVEPILPFLQTFALLSGLLLEPTLGGFGSYVEDLLSSQGALARSNPDLVLILLDLEDVAGQLPELCGNGVGSAVDQELANAVQHLAHLLQGVRAHSKARLLLQGFVVPHATSLGQVADANMPNSLPRAVQRLNYQLAALCASISDCVFYDMDATAAQHGRLRWTDQRLFLSSRLPVAAANFATYSQALVRSLRIFFHPPRKVLCTDLDNTLWGGVLGEEGVQGIVTGTTFPGTPFHNYQRYLKQLASRGILLAAVSKNNEADVREAFTARAADLALTLDDFAALKISWNEKAQSLRELASELSLGLDSFVFVDDNPAEALAIRQQLPEVAVIEAPTADPWKLLDLLADQPFFDVLRVTADDQNRLTDYKAQAQRADLEATAGGRDEFLASLGIVCTVLGALEAPLARSVQLLAKTNQFNLTTRRHSASEIEDFAAVPGGLAIAVRVRDRFGDAGVVGLALARSRGAACVIDSLVLSCRVIGRGIESALLACLAQHASHRGAAHLIGEFIPSKKNAPAASFYPEHGFQPVSNEGSDTLIYRLDLSPALPAVPPWITLEGTLPHEPLDRPAVPSHAAR